MNSTLFESDEEERVKQPLCVSALSQLCELVQYKGRPKMAYFYVNKNAQSNGDHEVHKIGCSFIPAQHNRVYLGDFATCSPAVREAKRYYSQVNGCFYCSRSCHTG